MKLMIFRIYEMLAQAIYKTIQIKKNIQKSA